LSGVTGGHHGVRYKEGNIPRLHREWSLGEMIDIAASKGGCIHPLEWGGGEN